MKHSWCAMKPTLETLVNSKVDFEILTMDSEGQDLVLIRNPKKFGSYDPLIAADDYISFRDELSRALFGMLDSYVSISLGDLAHVTRAVSGCSRDFRFPNDDRRFYLRSSMSSSSTNSYVATIDGNPVFVKFKTTDAGYDVRRNIGDYRLTFDISMLVPQGIGEAIAAKAKSALFPVIDKYAIPSPYAGQGGAP